MSTKSFRIMLPLLIFLLTLTLGSTARALEPAEPAPAAAGQEETPQKAEEEECPPTFGPLITETAVPAEKGSFAIQPLFQLSFITDSLTPNWRRDTAGGNFKQFYGELKLTYGLWDNLEVFAVVPYIHNWANDVNQPGPNGQRSANSGGISDLSLTLKYQLVKETATIPTVTLQFTTDFPTGRYRRPNPARLGTDVIGGGSYVFTTGFDLSKCLKPFVLYANVWYSIPTSYSQRVDDDAGIGFDQRIHPRDVVTVNLAAEYIITPKWIALLEFLSFYDGGRLFGPKSNQPPAALMSILPGIEYMHSEKLGFALGVQVDVAGKNTEAAVTPVFSFVYNF